MNNIVILTAINENVVTVSKKGVSVYVSQYKNIVMITDQSRIMLDDLPLVMLVGTFNNEDEAHKDYERLVGEMCVSDYCDCYFEDVSVDIHMRTVDLSYATIDEVKDAVLEVKNSIAESMQKSLEGGLHWDGKI